LLGGGQTQHKKLQIEEAAGSTGESREDKIYSYFEKAIQEGHVYQAQALRLICNIIVSSFKPQMPEKLREEFKNYSDSKL